MELTDRTLDEYRKLSRFKDTWRYSFEVNGYKTQFQIVKAVGKYEVHIRQKYSLSGWAENILLGIVTGAGELEDLFLAVTRGDYL